MIKNPVFFFLLVANLATVPIFAQENPNFQNILGKLKTYTSFNAPEKVYVQTDKDFYTNGETIWFKAYILNGITHQPSPKSKVVYVELLNANDSLVVQRKLYADDLGSEGDIEIGDAVEQGNYLLRAYTQYMLNDEPPIYFLKEIPIWVQEIDEENLFLDSKNPSVDGDAFSETSDSSNIMVPKPIRGKPLVRFFPEGGDLIAGLESIIGFKVTDAEGNGLALEGKIMDEDGNMVVPFRSYDFGLGATHFKPRANTAYYASIPMGGIEEKHPLPVALPKGYVLQVRNLSDHLLVQVTTNNDAGLQGTMLLGHLRGDQFFKRIEKDEGKSSYTLKLLTAELDDGVAQFTLFAQNGEPVCERLTFIDSPDNEISLSITTDKIQYGYREEAETTLELSDGKGKPVNGNFSLGIVAENSLDTQTPDIKSWLLLNSDLGGSVENPGYFFKDGSNARKYLLDALMLTHGWWRFVWKEMLARKVTPKLDYPPEKGIMITGRTTAFKNRYQPKKSMTTLTLFGGEAYQEKKATNLQGRFSFGPLIFQDSVEAIVNAVDLEQNKNGKSEFSIYVDPPAPKIEPIDSVPRKLNTTTIEYARQYLETAYRKKVADFRYDPQVTQLKEVVVEAKMKTRQELINEEINSLTLYGTAQNRLFPDSIPGSESSSVFDLLRRVAGVQVLGGYPNQRVQIRGISSFTGSSDPLYLIDGSQVDAGFIQGMRSNEIMFVDVLKGTEAAIYGSRASNGVVAVYTKRGLSFTAAQERYPGVTNFEVPGFYKAREFFSPDYAKPKPAHNKPDYRSTLHWEPDINVSGKAKSTLNFYTGDKNGKYLIKVEGITNDGRPVRGLFPFEVEGE